MKSSIRSIITAGAALLLGLLAAPVRAIAGPYSIDIVIAPYHPGVVDSWFFDINNQGQSTGYIASRPPGGPITQSAVIYRNGDIQSLASGSFTGNYLVFAGLSINNFGDVAGTMNGDPYFFSVGGTATPIQIPGNFVDLQISGIPGGLNDSGNALISAYPNNPSDTPPGAFSGLALWNSSGSAALSSLDPLYPYVNPPDPNDFNSGPSSSTFTASVTHLNHSNQFAGSIHQIDFDPMDPANPDDDVFTEQFTHAYLYNGQGGYSFLVPPTAGDEIRPIDIDEAGTVFGWAGSQLALWGPNGVLQSLLPDPGTTLDDVGRFGFPSAQRNNLGQVVALTIAGGVLFYDPVSNAWADITPTIAGLGTGTISSIQGFNDLGQFVGLVRPPAGGGDFGYVVSPAPEPSTWALLGLGLPALLGSRRRK